MWFSKKIKSHLNTKEAINLAKKLKVNRLFLTQIGHTYPLHQTAQKEIKKYLRKQKSPYPKEVRLAYDGMRVKVSPKR